MKINQRYKYPLNTIYFYLTEGCNLRCCHCWINPKYENRGKTSTTLDLNLFKSIIKQAKLLGLSSVKLTGGEPLLHPKIHKILEIVKVENLRLIIETNGVLCTSKIVRVIAACKNPFVSVSLDGANSETHEKIRGVKGCFEQACKGIENLVKSGIKPQIIMTLMRRNKNQIEKIIRLAESLGGESVKFNILQPTERGEKIHAKDALPIKEYINTGKLIYYIISKKTNLRIIYDEPIAFHPFNKMFSNEGYGICDIFSIIGVLANGSYALCGIGESVPELIFGHAAKDSLKEIWNNNKILKQIRKGVPKNLQGICKDCIMKFSCFGKCIAQNYYSTKNLFAGFWYCEEAYKEGLFPKTRLFSSLKNISPKIDTALYNIYSGVIKKGGIPLHTAFIKKDKYRILLSGPCEVGKTTCCKRIPQPWQAIRDEEVLIVRYMQKYYIHTLPTGDDFIKNRHNTKKTYYNQKGVPLSAIFFLEQSKIDKVIPINQRQATTLIYDQARFKFRPDMLNANLNKREYIGIKNKIFNNSYNIAKQIPIFKLYVSLNGRFWEKIDEVLKNIR